MYDPTPASETLVAASKAIDKLLGKFALEPGSHLIDETLTVRLTGMLEKAPEQHYEGKPDLPTPLLLALLCKRAKFNRGDAKRLIQECAEATINFAGAVPEQAGFADRLRDAEDAMAEAVAAGPKTVKSRAGATKWLGTCTIAKTS